MCEFRTVPPVRPTERRPRVRSPRDRVRAPRKYSPSTGAITVEVAAVVVLQVELFGPVLSSATLVEDG